MKSLLFEMSLTLLVSLIYSQSFLFAQEETGFEMLPVSEEAFYTMIQFFQYDKDIPLEARVIEKVETTNYIREKIVFQGVNRFTSASTSPVFTASLL